MLDVTAAETRRAARARVAALRAHLLPPRVRGVQRVREPARRRATASRRARASGAPPARARASGASSARPRVDDERLDLYARWHAGREETRGWEPNPQTRERYALEFAFAHPCAREAAFYDDAAGGRLVGVGLFDETPRALSAAFFFHDPGLRALLARAPANVLALVADARATGRPARLPGLPRRGLRLAPVQGRVRPARAPDDAAGLRRGARMARAGLTALHSRGLLRRRLAGQLRGRPGPGPVSTRALGPFHDDAHSRPAFAMMLRSLLMSSGFSRHGLTTFSRNDRARGVKAPPVMKTIRPVICGARRTISA